MQEERQDADKRKQAGMKKRKYLLFGILFLIGLCLAAYPFVSNLQFEKQQEAEAKMYEGAVQEMSEASLEKEWEKAEEYNRNHRTYDGMSDPFATEEGIADEQYEKALNLKGDGIMGYIEIPRIHVYLPIYHGTDDEVLKKGVGHLEQTSLPIGGESTHAVLSAHTGLPAASLFTDLLVLEEGDQFYIHILDEILAYEVDEKQVVVPDNTSGLKVYEGKDYVTLVTCTPYGQNTDRLLVRGHRITYHEEDAEKEKQKQGESVWKEKYTEAAVEGLAGALGLYSFIWFIRRRKRKKSYLNKNKKN